MRLLVGLSCQELPWKVLLFGRFLKMLSIFGESGFQVFNEDFSIIPRQDFSGLSRCERAVLWPRYLVVALENLVDLLPKVPFLFGSFGKKRLAVYEQ